MQNNLIISNKNINLLNHNNDYNSNNKSLRVKLISKEIKSLLRMQQSISFRELLGRALLGLSILGLIHRQASKLLLKKYFRIGSIRIGNILYSKCLIIPMFYKWRIVFSVIKERKSILTLLWITTRTICTKSSRRRNLPQWVPNFTLIRYSVVWTTCKCCQSHTATWSHKTSWWTYAKTRQ